jgi:uncharacterized DUF497 family protein
MRLRFEWNTDKAHRNLKKHGVSFDEAQTIFFDDNGILIHDPDHSDEEDRFILIGMSAQARVLVVGHTYREDHVIRLISARKADSVERQQYGS